MMVEPQDPNGKPQHKLGQLLSEFGGLQGHAFTAIQEAIQAAAQQQGLQGVFQDVTVQVGSESVTVSGNVINGMVYIGTAYVK